MVSIPKRSPRTNVGICKFTKDLSTKRRKPVYNDNITLDEEYNAVISRKLPKKT